MCYISKDSNQLMMGLLGYCVSPAVVTAAAVCTLLDAIQSPDIADRVGLSTADKKNSANDEYKLRPACEQQRRCKETDSIRVLLSSVVQKIKLSSICSFVGSSKRMGQHGVHICGIKENIVTCSDGNLNLELVPSAD